MSAGTASRRSRMKRGEPPLSREGMAVSSKSLGAEQLLGEQHRDGAAAPKHHGQRGLDRRDRLGGAVGAKALDVHRLEHRDGALPHRILPWIGLAEIAAHAYEGEKRKPAALDQGKHVDA